MENFQEFLNKQYARIENSHGDMLLKVQESEEQLKNLKEQVLMCEGFLDYYRRFRNEFLLQEKNAASKAEKPKIQPTQRLYEE